MKSTLLFLWFPLLLGVDYPASNFIPKITWVENVEGDFSFKDEWSYGEGVYKNEWGQLDCDGLCPPEIDFLKDEKGKIKEDKLQEFYSIIDTTHHYYTLSCTSNCSEFAGTHYMRVRKYDDKNWEAISFATIATHCVLALEVKNNVLSVISTLTSIMPDGDAEYTCTEGEIYVDKNAWAKDILKARFNFSFVNMQAQKEIINWSGLIHAPVKR